MPTLCFTIGLISPLPNRVLVAHNRFASKTHFHLKPSPIRCSQVGRMSPNSRRFLPPLCLPTLVLFHRPERREIQGQVQICVPPPHTIICSHTPKLYPTLVCSTLNQPGVILSGVRMSGTMQSVGADCVQVYFSVDEVGVCEDLTPSSGL